MDLTIQKGESDGMNKIYKVIYSKVRHCYVVVSEIARNQGKAHSTHTNIPGGGVCNLALALD
jgi:trimeric autotransporter adhesin